MPTSCPTLPPRASALIGAIVLVACGLSLVAAEGISQPESTRRMAQRLREITDGLDPTRNQFNYTSAARNLGTLLASARTPGERMTYLLPYANALQRSGQMEQAIREYGNFEQLLRENNVTVTSALATQLRTAVGMSYLRWGEVENCLLNHNGDSCLLPIRGGGVHTQPRGSRGAIAQFTPQLEAFPGDLRARWLLNIAYMTLGEYPDKVPPQWLIDPRHFESDHPLPRFPDVAGALGLDIEGLAGGVVLEDFDRDGFVDVMVSSWGFTPDDQLRLFRSNGDGTFTERTKEAGLIGEISGLNLIQGDCDNDGYADVLVLRGAWLGPQGRYPLSLLRNNRDGTFTDLTEAAGLLRFRPTQTAVWFDYDGDGWLDIFVGNEAEGPEVHPCELFRNNGDGTFTECAEENGLAVIGFVKAVVTADYNNDGRPDLYLSRRDGANHLFRNDGPAGRNAAGRPLWKFTDMAAEAGVLEPYRSFSAWFFDYNNDGWEDLFVSGYYIQDVGDIAADYLGLPHGGEKARLYRNRGDGTFADATREAGLYKLLHTMGCNFGDLDNDGWLDFYVGTGDPEFTTLIPNRMFRNDGGRRFQDVTTAGGFGQLQKGHGIAFGDLDNDGDQDIYSVVGGAITVDTYHNQLFANPGHGHRWLKLELEGVKSNRLALGARIKVVVQTPLGERELHRTVRSGGSFGASPLRQEIGLGAATGIARVEIFWPTTGATQVLTGIEPDTAYRIREGAKEAQPAAHRAFALPAGGGHHHHHAH